MKKLFVLSLLSLTLATTPSCKKYLDIRPYGKIIPKTPEEFASLLHDRLGAIDEARSEDWLLGNADRLADWDGGYGDDFETALFPTNLPVYLGDLVGTTRAYTPWTQLYQLIRDCNICIAGIPDSSTDKTGRRALATAYALRGAAYYQLIRLYAPAPQAGKLSDQLGVPLVTEVDIEAHPQRSSLQETLDQAERDLLASIALQNDQSIFRFTQEVAQGYLARLYFWSEQWAKAAPLAEALLQKHPLTSGETFVKMTTERSGTLQGNQLLKSGRIIASNDQAYTNAKTNIARRPISLRYIDAFPEAERTLDQRYLNWVGKKRAVKKEFFAGLRSAELLLIAAECLAHLGQDAEALALINQLRAHRLTTDTPLTLATLPGKSSQEIITVDATGKALTTLLATILRERRKELLLEGDRFFELKRNGSPSWSTLADGRTYITASYMYTLPIPPIDITLSHLKQNDHYEDYINQ